MSAELGSSAWRLAAVLALVLLLGGEPSIFSVALAYGLAESLHAALLALLLTPALHAIPQASMGLGMLRAAVPLIIASAGSAILARSDVLMLGALSGAHAVAQYQPALSLADIALGIHGGVLVTFLPAISRSIDGSPLSSAYRMASRASSTVVIPAAVVVCVWGADITEVVYGPSFVGSAGIYALVGLSPIVHTTFGPNGAVLVSRQRNRALIQLTMVLILANITLNLALIPIFGPIGAATATLAAYILNNALTMRVLTPHIDQHLLRDVVRPSVALAGGCLVGVGVARWIWVSATDQGEGVLLLAGAAVSGGLALVGALTDGRRRELMLSVLSRQ